MLRCSHAAKTKPCYIDFDVARTRGGHVSQGPAREGAKGVEAGVSTARGSGSEYTARARSASHEQMLRRAPCGMELGRARESHAVGEWCVCGMVTHRMGTLKRSD